MGLEPTTPCLQRCPTRTVANTDGRLRQTGLHFWTFANGGGRLRVVHEMVHAPEHLVHSNERDRLDPHVCGPRRVTRIPYTARDDPPEPVTLSARGPKCCPLLRWRHNWSTAQGFWFPPSPSTRPLAQPERPSKD
jgi:hypothetical protein